MPNYYWKVTRSDLSTIEVEAETDIDALIAARCRNMKLAVIKYERLEEVNKIEIVECKGTGHTILDYKPTNPNFDGDTYAIRAEYREMIARAKEIRYHDSGWVAYIEWANKDDSKRAEQLENEWFIIADYRKRD